MKKTLLTILLVALLPLLCTAQDSLRTASNFGDLLQVASAIHDQTAQGVVLSSAFTLDSGAYFVEMADTTRTDDVDFEIDVNATNGGSWHRRVEVKEKGPLYHVDVYDCIIDTKVEMIAKGITLTPIAHETCVHSVGLWTWEEFQKFFRKEIDLIMAYKKPN